MRHSVPVSGRGALNEAALDLNALYSAYSVKPGSSVHARIDVGARQGQRHSCWCFRVLQRDSTQSSAARDTFVAGGRRIARARVCNNSVQLDKFR